MRTEQISLTDWAPDAWPAPEMWACMESCAHMGKDVDHFPGRPETPRCMYGTSRAGTGGSDMYETVDPDGRVHVYCRYYQRKM